MPPLSRTIVYIFHDDAFLCHPCPCFRKLKKLQKLREDTRKLEEELKEALLRSCMDRLAKVASEILEDNFFAMFRFVRQ